MMKKVVSVSRLIIYHGSLFVLFTCCNIVSSAGRILLKLGKVQFELQKLLDTYVSCMLQPRTFREAICVILKKLRKLLFHFYYYLQRSQIFKTITRPSESLLNDLRTVEV